MRIKFTETAIKQLQSIKSYIARNNPQRASKHIKKIIDGAKKILVSPYIGKVNAVYNREDIRETVIGGNFDVGAEFPWKLFAIHDIIEP